ncbi:UV-endonuclease UvdE-domain-containing protein [Rhypophila decipiens]|uniref:UV-endonuclease UvdE-domain-containing protein n=1 Tax=Rhypophila decipiens TaxID=261697 RepID=A0AAN7B566_9PEZI|nr:UV-endonuclease UvdE-domain-containing protein [Rhypophila decipiens]
MTRKRKASSSPSNKDPETPTEGTSLRPEVILRRSSRRLTSKDHNEDEAKTREMQETMHGPRDGDTGRSRQRARAGMEEAIEGLKRLEKQFEENTRRDKLRLRKDDDRLSSDSPSGGTSLKAVISHAVGTRKRTKDGSLSEKGKAQVPADDEQAQRPLKRPFGTPKKPGDSLVDEDSDYQEVLEAPLSEDAEVSDRGPGRPLPVNSGYLPLPWKGRLGYACLNTYLRAAKPSVFSSRTCRIDSILKHRHPLRDPSQPEHPKLNPIDNTQEYHVKHGQKFVQDLGLANARDIVKMLRWNDKYNIKFMRLSSEMFPFASHPEHGYKLAPFASEVLAEVGKVATQLGHRLTTHPGQFTQLGSPHEKVITASIRDLEYHDEMLSLLRLPPQQDRDAVMILHMGGVYEGKSQTLDRFRKNYAALSLSVKSRLVLENDDVSWSVHDLLPICEELNIPLVLDYHHHNIVFDSSQCREGTYDISQPEIMARIAKTWTRKGIKQKMHYSEPCAGAVTGRDRRKHSPRVATLPPCPNDMDLMIEAKDKEQAVFELMRNFKLPGFERIGDMIPHERSDQNPVVRKVVTKDVGDAGKGKRKRGAQVDKADGDKGANGGEEDIVVADGKIDGDGDTLKAEEVVDETIPGVVSAEDFGMGGKDGRVYWPPGREDWLKAAPRIPKKGVGNGGNGNDKGNGKGKGKAKKASKEENDYDDSCGE